MLSYGGEVRQYQVQADPKRLLARGLSIQDLTQAIEALGLIPMLIATGVGSEVQRPLATVVVGGLASSTFLTLFVLPALYELFSRGVQSRLSDSIQ